MKGPVGQLEVSFSRLVVLRSITRSKGPAADANDEAGVTDPIVRKDVKVGKDSWTEEVREMRR